MTRERVYLRFKRRSRNPGTAKQFGTGDVYRGRRLTGFFFIAEWEFKADAEAPDILPFNSRYHNEYLGLKSATVHVFDGNGTSISFYWEPERGYFNPRANVSGHNIHKLVARFVPSGVIDSSRTNTEGKAKPCQTQLRT